MTINRYKCNCPRCKIRDEEVFARFVAAHADVFDVAMEVAAEFDRLRQVASALDLVEWEANDGA